jgi:hypothetical protein
VVAALKKQGKVYLGQLQEGVRLALEGWSDCGGGAEIPLQLQAHPLGSRHPLQLLQRPKKADPMDR